MTRVKCGIMGAMKKVLSRVRTKKQQEVLVDNDIYEQIKDKYVWVKLDKKNNAQSVKVSEFGNRNGEVLSRFITKAQKGFVVDHIDGNVLDNRRKNLRVCTQAENSRNKNIQKNNTSGTPSVRWQKDAKAWRVRFKYLKQKIQIGYFKDKEEACYVRDQVTIQLHKNFARLYFFEKGEIKL